MLAETPQLMALACLMLLPFYAFSVAYYNVYHHPLKSFPGPWTWAAFRLPHVLSRLRGRNHKDTLEQFRKYGPVVRIAPDELAFSQPEAWRDINARSGKYAENVKDINAWPPMQPGWDRSLPLASEDLHRQLRRTYGPAFSTQAVQEQEEMILRYVDLFIAQLEKAVSEKPVQNIDKWFNFFTFDIMGDFAFGQSFKSLENSEYHSWVGSVLENVHLGIIVTQLQRYGLWSILEQLVPKSWFAARDTCNDYVQQVVDRRLEKGHLPDKVDLFNYLLESKDDDETTLSRQDLCANAFFIVMAGSETVATLLTGLTWFLCSNPDTLTLATREARLAFTNSEDINMQTASKLRYINAVLKEGLRIFPPAAEGSPRVISSPVQPIAGYEVPMGTTCSVPAFAANHYERNFIRPDEFLPGRWLGGEEFQEDRQDVSQPFSSGPRNCIGINLAEVERQLALTKLLWHFDVALDGPESRDWYYDLKILGLWEKKPLPLRIRRRKGAGSEE